MLPEDERLGPLIHVMELEFLEPTDSKSQLAIRWAERDVSGRVSGRRGWGKVSAVHSVGAGDMLRTEIYARARKRWMVNGQVTDTEPVHTTSPRMREFEKVAENVAILRDLAIADRVREVALEQGLTIGEDGKFAPIAKEPANG